MKALAKTVADQKGGYRFLPQKITAFPLNFTRKAPRMVLFNLSTQKLARAFELFFKLKNKLK